ncbi:MAG: hypothetical protein NTW47_00700 [Proteobacteria bacterium]|nr:hypothetical protein [Pseudomonadota bacterium]
MLAKLIRSILGGSGDAGVGAEGNSSDRLATRQREAGLISENYRKMQQQLHENPQYGVASVAYAPMVAQIMEIAGASELLDYGAGKGRLGETLKQHIQRPLVVHHYDPAIPAWAEPPQPCPFVACIDVLEHIEPALIDNVLDDLKRVVTGVGTFTVHTGPAVKHLPDGRNAHLIQQPAAWWLPKILDRFELGMYKRLELERGMSGSWVVVEPKRN